MVDRASKEVRRFRRIVEAYDKKAERWRTRGNRIVKRYADERSEAENTRARYNVLWSNVETLKPFLYSSTPKPIVERRFKDADPVARLAAEVVQRALAFLMQAEHFGSALRNARDDYLLPGRGTAWVRYVPHYAPAQVDNDADTYGDDQGEGAGEDDAAEQAEIVVYEEVVPDYVNWRDFGHTVAPVWEQVDCVWRWVRMSRKALIARFGEEIGRKVPLDCQAEDTQGPNRAGEDEDGDRALICELWCKSERRAVWFSKGFPELLDDLPDPLGLDEFFPCPRPVYATLTTDSLIPVPDYVEYQDQADELDNLTARINALTDAIKAAGVYDSSVPALKELLQDGHDNTLIAVENWAALSEKGGLKGAIELLPMRDVAATLISLYDAREKVKADLYEITGMSDIIRGNTAPDETATAQKIKSNFATKRLAERQAEVARFAGNLVHIMGNVVARLFSPETLMVMTGIKLLTADEKQAFAAFQQQAKAAQEQGGQPSPMPQPALQPPPPPRGMTADEVSEAMELPTWDEVFALLRNDPERRFRIDVETDSLVSADDAEEQQETVEFFQAVGSFIQQAVQAAEQQPVMAPLLAKMLMFGVRRFRIARELESDFEEAIDKLQAIASQPQQPKPDPAMAKVQGELQLQREKQQFEQQQTQAQQAHAQQIELADQQHRHAMEGAAHMAGRTDASTDAQLEVFKAHLEAANDAQQARLQATLDQQAAQLKATVDILIARINAFAKIEAAGEAKGATHDTAAEQHEQEQGA